MIEKVLIGIWDYFVLTAPYLLVGFLASGIIHEYLKLDVIKKHLSGKGLGPIFKASLVGVPLPLCSCAVVPAAVTLKKEGASNGATSSFLISTPESGIDSMVMTYGVMDIPMTIIRPLAAFLTAFFAGLGQNLFNNVEGLPDGDKSGAGCCKKSQAKKEGTAISRILKFGFVDLVNDLSGWLTIGLVVGALMNVFLPVDLFTNVPDWGEKLIVLAFGIPFYICASASTPIAASMMMKGMSPGTALIFLLVGPATNFTNLAVLQKYLGKKGVMINILAIAFVSLGLSYLVDFAYSNFSWPTVFNIETMNHVHHAWWHHALAGILALLLVKGVYIESVKPYLQTRRKKAQCCG